MTRLLMSLALACTLPLGAATILPAAQAASPAPAATGVLATTDLTDAVPATVYFKGKVASTQLRNSGGVRSSDGKLTEFMLVDTSGYSSSVRETYQFYLISDVALQVEGKTLPAGAYGAGFVQNDLVVMDLGGNVLFHAPTHREEALKRPRPLQVLPAADAAHGYRLYLGRDFVTFSQRP